MSAYAGDSQDVARVYPLVIELGTGRVLKWAQDFPLGYQFGLPIDFVKRHGSTYQWHKEQNE